jgi:hypothetical protein
MTTSIRLHELVEALVHEADLDLAVAHLLERRRALVRELARDLVQLACLARARVASRRGVKRSTSARARTASRPRRR